MFRCADGLKPDKGDLHGGECSEGIVRTIRDVETGRVTTHEEQDKGVEGEQVCDEDVSSPCGDHVKVKEGGESSPKGTSCFEGTDPEEEGEHEQENGNGFVVVGSCHRSRDVAWEMSAQEEIAKLKGQRESISWYLVQFL
jgi:hypothetical protein